MAGAAAFSSFSSTSSYSLLLLLRQVLLMSAASSDFKAAAYGAFFGAAAALLVSHLLLELTFSAVFSTLFSFLFFCLSLLVLQRAFALHAAVPPPALLPPADHQGKPQQQLLQQHRSAAAAAEPHTIPLAATATGARRGEGAAQAAPLPPLAAADAESSRGDVEEIYLEEEREDSEAEALLQQQHAQQEYCRRQKERLQVRRMLFGLAAMLAVSALVAAVVDTRKFQTFHWLLKMPLYIFLSNSLCFLLVFAAVDVVNFYYDVAHFGGKAGHRCFETAAAASAAFAPSADSAHYIYTALSTSPPPSLPFDSHSITAGYSPVGCSPPPLAASSASSLSRNATAAGGVGSAAADSLFSQFPPSSTPMAFSHTRFSSCTAAAALSPVGSSAPGLAAADAAAGTLPVHNTLQVYVLLAGSVLLGTTFGFFYGLFRFEASPNISIQLIRSRYVCLPLAVIIGSLAGVLVKRIGSLSAATAAACALQQQQPYCAPLPFLTSTSLASAATAVHQSPAATATAAHCPFNTAAAAAADTATEDANGSMQQQQLFPITTAAAGFLEAEEEDEEVEEENLLTFSAAEQRQLLLLA